MSNLKEVELRLVSELMKSSRRSDRELARVMNVSQPTVTRVRQRLEKQGLIKEYTMIPDFTKLGCSLLVLNLVKLKQSLTAEQTEKARDEARRSLQENHDEIIMLERGIGSGKYDGVFLSIHKDYSSYLAMLSWLRNFDFLEVSSIESFVVNLDDKIHYRSLTLSTVANYILKLRGMK